jgi:glycosyltransferase involved in cell wall biosynthesis
MMSDPNKLGPKISPKISIIVPAYNVEPYIERCLNSILEQNFGDFEILLVLECRSTDLSMEICHVFAQKDNRIVLCHEDGTGISAARNRGLSDAKGEFVTFIDADDYILPGMFGAMYERAAKQNLDILCCGAKRDLGNQDIGQMDDYVKFDDEIFVVGPHNQRDYMYKLAISGRTITVWGKFYRRDFLNEKRLRFHPDAYTEDSIFSFGCCTAAKRVATTQDQFYVYCDRPGSRVYSSETIDIERSAEIIWGLFLGYGGSAADDVRAFAAARIVSSTLLFSLTLKQMPVGKMCKITWGTIQRLGLSAHILRACDKANFDEYAKAVGMSETAAENYRLFIESLQNYDSMLAWQMRYKKIEEKVGKWNMPK